MSIPIIERPVAIDLNAPGIIVYISGADVEKVQSVTVYFKNDEREDEE